MLLKQQETTLSLDSIERFRSSLLARGRSENTVKGYTTDLRMFLKDLEVETLSAQEFEESAMNWLTGTRLVVKPKTTGRRLTSLKMYAKWAKWPVSLDEYSAPTPLRGQPHPLPEGIEGVRRMISHAKKPEHAALVALCGLCGLRVAEALAVRPSHFNLDEMMLTIRGKGDKTRRVPVSTQAWEVLIGPVTRSFCNGDALVVGLKDRFARTVITNLAVKAGLERHVATHDLRATFATAVYDKTMNPRLVQELLGHASGKTTEIYIGLTNHTLHDGVNLY